MHPDGKATGEPGHSVDEVGQEGHPLPGLPCCRSQTVSTALSDALAAGLLGVICVSAAHPHCVRFGTQKRGREALPALLQPKTQCHCASPVNTGPLLRPVSTQVHVGTGSVGSERQHAGLPGAAAGWGASLQR